MKAGLQTLEYDIRTASSRWKYHLVRIALHAYVKHSLNGYGGPFGGNAHRATRMQQFVHESNSNNNNNNYDKTVFTRSGTCTITVSRLFGAVLMSGSRGQRIKIMRYTCTQSRFSLSLCDFSFLSFSADGGRIAW